MPIKSLYAGLLIIIFTISFSAAAEPSLVKWVEQTQFNGDFRYRQDWLKEDVNGIRRDGRYRHRIRARFGFHTEIEDGWGLGARISTMDGAATTGGSPDSYNQTLEKNASKKLVGWDQAYVQWKNDMGWMVKSGKMANPFYTPQGSQILFDVDYTPEGVALKTPYYFTTAGYILDDRALTSGSNTKMDPDAWLWASQVKFDGGGSGNGENLSYTVGAGYYHFFNVEGYTNLYTTNTTFPFLSNTSTADGATNKYKEPYQVAQLFGEIQPLRSLPVTLYADVIQNIAISKNNFGWVTGAKYGNLGKAKTWDMMYSFRRTESDSTISALNDSDFSGGRDQAYGHIVNLRYGITDRVRLAAYYTRSWIGASHSDAYERVFLDLNISL